MLVLTTDKRRAVPLMSMWLTHQHHEKFCLLKENREDTPVLQMTALELHQSTRPFSTMGFILQLQDISLQKSKRHYYSS